MSHITSHYLEQRDYMHLWEYVFFLENGEQCSDQEYLQIRDKADKAYQRYNEFKIEELNRNIIRDIKRDRGY